MPKRNSGAGSRDPRPAAEARRASARELLKATGWQRSIAHPSEPRERRTAPCVSPPRHLGGQRGLGSASCRPVVVSGGLIDQVRKIGSQQKFSGDQLARSDGNLSKVLLAAGVSLLDRQPGIAGSTSRSRRCEWIDRSCLAQKLVRRSDLGRTIVPSSVRRYRDLHGRQPYTSP